MTAIFVFTIKNPSSLLIVWIADRFIYICNAPSNCQDYLTMICKHGSINPTNCQSLFIFNFKTNYRIIWERGFNFKLQRLYFKWDVPGYIENTTFLLTYTTIFLVLMSLGIALSRLKVVSWTHASILGAVRVIIGPIIGFSLIKFLNLNGFFAGVLLIQSAMPSAVLTYLVGSMYSERKVVDNIASVIVSSTLMSFITIPIVVFYSLKFFQ